MSTETPDPKRSEIVVRHYRDGEGSVASVCVSGGNNSDESPEEFMQRLADAAEQASELLEPD